MPRAEALPPSEGSVPWILHHTHHNLNSLSVTCLIGLNFQKQKLQCWEAMNKSGQFPHWCNRMDFEIIEFQAIELTHYLQTFSCLCFTSEFSTSQFPCCFLPWPPHLSSHFPCLQAAPFLFLLFYLSSSPNVFHNLLWRQIKQESNHNPAWLWFLELDWHPAQLIA